MSNIDEKAKNNFTIEVRIFENYEKVKHEIIKAIDFLRCFEGNSIWYQIWIDPGDMMRIEPLLEGGDRLWCIEIQKYYVFFYEVRKGRRILGKGRIKEILSILL